MRVDWTQTLGQQGYSKDHRPVGSEMRPGNTADATTLIPVEGRRIRGREWVHDRADAKPTAAPRRARRVGGAVPSLRHSRNPTASKPHRVAIHCDGAKALGRYGCKIVTEV